MTKSICPFRCVLCVCASLLADIEDIIKCFKVDDLWPLSYVSLHVSSPFLFFKFPVFLLPGPHLPLPESLYNPTLGYIYFFYIK